MNNPRLRNPKIKPKKKNKPQEEGGIILQKEEILPILADKECVGIALALKIPGNAPNVDIQVLKVTAKDNMLSGEVCQINSKMGASSPLKYPASHCDDFCFHNLTELTESKFGFGYVEKSSLERIMKDEWDELFIGGTIIRFTQDDFQEVGDYFTFTVSARRKISTIWVGNKNNQIKTRALKQGNTVKLKALDSKTIFTPEDIKPINSMSDMENRKVISILQNEVSGKVEGLIFEGVGAENTLLFDENDQVEKVQLKQNQCLRKIITSDHLDIGESENMGMFPNTLHTFPCPPHWQGITSDYENILEKVVQEALK